MAEGVVYILINQAMPGLCKVGITYEPVTVRMKSLDNTSVPLPFECYYAARVGNCEFVEKRLHTAFGDHRVRSSREFFRIGPDRVRAALEIAAIEEVTPKIDIVETKEDEEALNEARKRRARFSFDQVNIPVGAELVSTFDSNIKCHVAGNRTVLFEGQETSLSDAALKVAKSKGYEWTTIAGPTYWLYNEKTLAEIRDEKEEESTST